ncbi:hypothetical protein H0X48_04080 [Candidatus Dependentiae bacterium]|nr:hypothetical protein [Candidatus Dependentiae bacterium]
MKKIIIKLIFSLLTLPYCKLSKAAQESTLEFKNSLTLNNAKLKNIVVKAESYYTQAPEKSLIIQNIVRGAAVHYALTSNNSSLGSNLLVAEQYESNIKALVWFYFAQALAKNQQFNDGTFIIQDTSDRVFAYLKKCPSTYGRISTHFTSYLKASQLSVDDKKQFGLDIDHLPSNKKTILFGVVDPSRHLFFIKPESAGVKQFKEALRHGIHLVAAQLRKVPSCCELWALKFFQGSSTPKVTAVARWFSSYLGSDDSPTSRKERVPLDARLKFGTLLYALKSYALVSDAVVSDYISKASIYGISYMYAEAIKLKAQTCTPQALSLVETFIQELESVYDHLGLRFGREVILTDFEL